MADSYIGVEEASVPTKKLDTEQIVIGANTVERERVQLVGALAAAIAAVQATTPDGTEQALVTRPVALGAFTDAAWDGSAASASVIALHKLIATRGGGTPVFV